MIRYLWILLPFLLNAQAVLFQETFSDYSPDWTRADLTAGWLLDPTGTEETDLSGGGFTLTKNGGAGDSLLASSPISATGSSVRFVSALSQKYSIASTGNAGLRPGTDSLTVLFWAKKNDTNAEIAIHQGDGNNGSWVINASGTCAGMGALARDTANKFACIINNATITTNWYCFGLLFTRAAADSVEGYLDGLLKSRTEFTNDFDFNPSSAFEIGEFAGSYGDFYAAQALIFNGINLTKKQIKELCFLPTGRNWLSKAGGVTRDNWQFAQGVVADTIYCDSLITAGAWSVSIDDSAASGVAYSIITSADKATWITLAGGTTGTSWGTKTYSGVGLGYIGIAISSGTAFFDNLTVSESSATTTSKFKGNDYFDRFKGW